MPKPPLRVLFVCARNRLRSPTAEHVFATWPGVEASSAGLAPDADVPVTAEDVARADVVLAMEKRHVRRLRERFGRHLKGTRVVCLGIPDDYAFLDPALVALLHARVAPHLPRT